MTRIIIQHEGLTSEVSGEIGPLLEDVISLIDQALKGVGFSFDGQLSIVDEG